MKTFIFIVVMILASTNIFSQNNSIGIRSGVSFSNIICKDYFINRERRIGIVEGISYDYFFQKHFIGGIEANYEQRGFKEYIIFTDMNGSPTGRKEPIYLQFDYLTFPIKVDYRLGNKFFVLAGIGIIPAYIINANTIAPVFDQNVVVIKEEKKSVLNNITKFDFGGLAEIGGGFTIREKLSINVSFRYQRSFTSFTNARFFGWSETSKMRHITMLPSIGIKYSFPNKGNYKLPSDRK
ncbi:MAG: outer membrane beta-barrel protein [Bacteroidia bacterium]